MLDWIHKLPPGGVCEIGTALLRVVKEAGHMEDPMSHMVSELGPLFSGVLSNANVEALGISGAQAPPASVSVGYHFQHALRSLFYAYHGHREKPMGPTTKLAFQSTLAGKYTEAEAKLRSVLPHLQNLKLREYAASMRMGAMELAARVCMTLK